MAAEAADDLNLRCCWPFNSIAPEVGQLTALTRLDLSGTAISELPDTVGQLCFLQALAVYECAFLSSLPASLEHLLDLTCLEVSHSNVSLLPDGLWQLSKLRRLEVSHCRNLAELPAGVGHLSELTVLNLQGCRSLLSLPHSIIRLNQLQELNLTDCAGLIELPDGQLGQLCLASLREMLLINCVGLTDLTLGLTPGPMRHGVVHQLRNLRLQGCSGLQVIQDMYCTSLNSLDLTGCSSLVQLPDLHGAVNLDSLTLRGCSSLRHLPEQLDVLVHLTSLDCSGCSSLSGLPNGISQLTNLLELKLQACSALKSLPNHLPQGLQSLDLSYCSEMSALAEGLMRLEKQLAAAGTRVKVQGWGVFLGLYVPSQQPIRSGWQPELVLEPKHGIASVLRAAINIQTLLTDRDFVLELLNRLSWLGVLLGAATFAGALAPPGGYDDGLLFVDYSAADVGARMRQLFSALW